MTDHTPRVEDKFGQTVEEGDTIEFFYGGDRFEETVTDTGLSTHGVPHIAATVTVTVPSGQVRVTKKAARKTTHRTNPSSTKGTN